MWRRGVGWGLGKGILENEGLVRSDQGVRTLVEKLEDFFHQERVFTVQSCSASWFLACAPLLAGTHFFNVGWVEFISYPETARAGLDEVFGPRKDDDLMSREGVVTTQDLHVTPFLAQK